MYRYHQKQLYYPLITYSYHSKVIEVLPLTSDNLSDIILERCKSLSMSDGKATA